MANLVISGDSSGSITLAAPAVSGTTILTLPTTSGTIVTTTGAASLTTSGNLTFTGTGNRITGDFSNATVANRVSFQTSTANTFTFIDAIPSGTGTASGFLALNSSDTVNNSFALMQAGSADIRFASSANGTGTALPMTFYTNGNERLRIDTSGNVGIGTSSPNARLSLGTNVGTAGQPNQLVLYEDATLANRIGLGISSGLLNIVGGAGTAIAFYTNGANERMRIDSSGRVLIGTSTAVGAGIIGTQIGVGYDGYATIPTTDRTYNPALFYNNAGTLVGFIQSTSSGTTFSTTSDYRLKENIAPMTGALAKVAQLKPVTYKWKVDGSSGQGFIAHELQEVVPECVTGEKNAVDAEGNPQYQGVDTSFLVATLTAAIQELNAKVTALEKQLGAK
jgi:hypothetical protein